MLNKAFYKNYSHNMQNQKFWLIVYETIELLIIHKEKSI